MLPWIVDADDIGETNSAEIFENTAIREFLDPENNTQFFLVAAKGFGKTLLLREKRIRMQAKERGYATVPAETLIDKPAGAATSFSQEAITKSKDEKYWEIVWSIAIAVAVTVRLGELKVSSLKCSPLKKHINATDKVNSVIDFFAFIYNMSNSDFVDAVNDFQLRLAPAYRQIQAPFVTFIDNIDEHFKIHIQAEGNGSQSSSWAGVLDPELWYDAQIGLARAVRALHGLTHHAKVFCSIRREAFEKIVSEPTGLQFRSNALIIEYKDRELRQIFEDNIERTKANRKINPKSPNHYIAFFGKENSEIVHPHVGEIEHVFDYIVRHTMRRPRDLMVIGKALEATDPEDRNLAAIRKVVDDQSRIIAISYLKEVFAHFLKNVDLDLLWGLIVHNIISKAEVAEISSAYNREIHGGEVDLKDPRFVHVFCSLYKAGLLGVLAARPGQEGKYQKFETPGERLFERDGILPDSEYYLIHPILDSIIRERSGRYLSNFDRINIVGANRPWRDGSNVRAVAKVDVVGYTPIMQDVVKKAEFDSVVGKYLAANQTRVELLQCKDGDSFTIMDANSLNVFSCVQKLAQELARSELKAQIRVGCDVGIIVTSERGELNGNCLRISARLEAGGSNGKALMTEAFVDHIKRFNGRMKFKDAVTLEDLKFRRVNGGYQVQKESGYDDATNLRLFYAEL